VLSRAAQKRWQHRLVGMSFTTSDTEADTMDQEYESELTASREEIAAVLSGVVDGITAGSIRFGDADHSIVVEVPEELELEIELEIEDDELSLELELEWPHTEVEFDEGPAEPTEESGVKDDDASADTTEEPPAEDDETPADTTKESFIESGALPMPVKAADSSQTLAGFEIFRDKGGEWRWRLRHRNGNIIAISGEGYTRKHNAQKGLRSVMQNAPGATVTEDKEN